MKIAITISRGGIARNILQNEFFELLKKEAEEIFLITTAHADDERFRQEFGAENVTFLPFIEDYSDKISGFLQKFNQLLVFNRNTKRLFLYDYVGETGNIGIKYIKYILSGIIFFPLSKISFIKKISWWVDNKFAQKNLVDRYRKMLEVNKPHMVFVTSLADENESALLKAAGTLGIPTVGMPKSWDNPSKRLFQTKADKVVVWNPFMTKQMVKLQGYKRKNIVEIGVPQFDHYIDKSKLLSKEEFCSKNSLDPQKKIIVFGSEGKLIPSDSYVSECLTNIINSDSLIDECQLFIRPHFGYKQDEKKFTNLLDKKNVVIDTRNNPSSNFRDKWDYSREQMDHLFNLICHADVLVTTCSTLLIDATAVGTPTILIFFDDKSNAPFYKSVRRWYECDYYHEIRKLKAAREAHSPGGLAQHLNELLKNPNTLLPEREKMIEEFIYKIDGLAGRRLFDVIKTSL